jgi:hypothetical protein
VATAIFLTLSTSTSTSAAAAKPRTDNLDSLGSAPGNESHTSDLNAEVHEATRNEAGNLLSITWSIENTGSEDTSITWIGDYSYEYDGPYFSGVIATSEDGSERYHPIMDENQACLCSGDINSDFRIRLEPDEQIAYWSMFSVPTDVDSVSVEIPGFEPIEDIPIS